jgi:threonine synthase
MTTVTRAPVLEPAGAAGMMRDMAASSADAGPTRILGLKCRNCGRAEAIGPSFVCPACFGPLEVAYDHAAIAASVSRAAIGSRRPGLWRYLELLPVDHAPARSLAVGSTPMVEAPWLAESLRVRRAWLKDDTRNPSLSFKDRGVALGTARALDFGFEALACASTGNLAGAVAAAAAAAGLPAYVFIPADLEPAKIDHALSYGATVVPVDGTYDDVNRLCLELTDELPWAFLNINLRPFYAEGSRTLAFEIAEDLGWRLPDVVVAPIASGALYTKLARGFGDLAAAGLVEAAPVRLIGGQAAGCAPVGAAFATGEERITPVRSPETIVRSLAIGSPADGQYALELARASGGSVESIDDAETAEAIRRVAARSGIFTETAGGVTLAAAEHAARRGIFRPGDEVVVLLTGNGLKTPDARAHGLGDDARSEARPGTPGLAPVVAPSLAAFERWLESAA